MKELVTVFAACAIAGAALAVDSNIVGYQMHNLKAGPNLMGVAWEGIGDSGEQIGLADIMDITQLTSYDVSEYVEGDYAQAWDINIGNWGPVYFYIDEPSWGSSYENTWMTDGYAPINPKLDAGQAFWLFLKDDINNFPFKGQVAESGAIITLENGPNLIANPLPRSVNLVDEALVLFGGQKTSYDVSEYAEGDSVQTWDYSIGNWGPIYLYIDEPTWGTSYENTWMTDGYVPGSAVVSAGSGFWYFAKKAGVEVTFKGL